MDVVELNRIRKVKAVEDPNIKVPGKSRVNFQEHLSCTLSITPPPRNLSGGPLTSLQSTTFKNGRSGSNSSSKMLLMSEQPQGRSELRRRILQRGPYRRLSKNVHRLRSFLTKQRKVNQQRMTVNLRRYFKRFIFAEPAKLAAFGTSRICSSDIGQLRWA